MGEYRSIGGIGSTHATVHASKKGILNDGHHQKHSLFNPSVVAASSGLSLPRSIVEPL
jgi:hypothetical protein